MEPPPPAAGWYPDPGHAGLRYWDGARWTEHVAGQPPPPPGRTPWSARTRLAVGIGGLVLLFLSVSAFLDGTSQGWGDGSFALASYGVAFGLAGVGAVLCWVALRSPSTPG